MHNPFCQSEKLHVLLERLKDGWDHAAYAQLMLALESEIFMARSFQNKPRLFKTGRLIECIDWLSQHWAEAPKLSLRLRGFLLTHIICDLAAETEATISHRNRYTDFAKILQTEWLHALSKKEATAVDCVARFGDTEAWLAWYLSEMFGLGAANTEELFKLCNEDQKLPGPSLYGLLSQKMTLTDVRERAFGDAVRDLQEVQIYVDSRISRPAAVVSPDGFAAMFIPDDSTNSPIDAARLAHEWAHIHHLRLLFKESPEAGLNASTFAKEKFAVRKEYEFLERLPSSDTHNIINAWVKQNIIDMILEFKQNLVWLTNVTVPCTDNASLVPLEAGVYVIAASHAIGPASV